MERFWLALGALAGLGAVALSAVAAHARLDAGAAASLRDAVQMQGWHAFALLFCGLRGGRWSRFAGWFFVVGMLAFCGAVYARVFWHGLPVSNVAPFGGVMLMVGWLMLLVGAFQKRGR